MAHSRFHDLNLSNATLIITDIVILSGIYFFASYYLSGIYSSAPPAFDLRTFAHLFFFTLPIQLTLLAVGLYNEKLRENFRGITLRITVAIVLAYLLTFTLTLLIPYLALPGWTKPSFTCLRYSCWSPHATLRLPITTNNWGDAVSSCSGTVTGHS